MFVCICAAVPDAEIRSCVARGASTVEEVGDACGAGTGCGNCLERICDRLRAADPLHGLDISAVA
jgi:bacterioferritin-associated ferredoxin